MARRRAAHRLGPSPRPAHARSPKRFWLPLHCVLGPLMPLVTSVFGWIGDRAAARHNRAHGMPPQASAAAAT